MFPLINRLTLFLLTTAALHAQITFTEVMYDPATSEFHDEYIEIYNLSDRAVDLTNWTLFDTVATDLLIASSNAPILAAKSYALILDGSYFKNSSTYEGLIPDSVLILRIADNGFGRSGLSNSVAKMLYLADSLGTVIDSFHYKIGYKPGHSNEKRVLSLDNSPENWLEALKKGGTPGLRNSVAPFELDLALEASSLSWSPLLRPERGKEIKFTQQIKNKGLNPFNGVVSFKLFNDINGDSLHSQDEKIIVDTTLNPSINSEAEWALTFSYTFNVAGTFNLISTLNSVLDENGSNNIAQHALTIIDLNPTIYISEIKFLTFNGEPEWIELGNYGNEAVNLNRWAISDGKDTTQIGTFPFLEPDSFLVLCGDSLLLDFYSIDRTQILFVERLPTFNNSSDVVYLLTPTGAWLEQLPYFEDWLEGEAHLAPSLERINAKVDARVAQNWGPSRHKNGATPGAKNSISTQQKGKLKSSINVTPNPFSPDSDGYEDYTLITLTLPVNTARIRVEIFDALGRKVRRLNDNYFSGDTHSVIWNGENEMGRRMPMGIYIVYAEILNDRNGVLKTEKTTVVLARKF